ARDVLLRADTDVEDLLALAAVADDRDAKAAELPREQVCAGDGLLARAVREVDRLRHAVVGVALERGLMTHVPLVVDLVRGLEDPGRVLGHPRNAIERAALRDLPHERVRVEAPLLGDPLERLVDEGQHPLTETRSEEHTSELQSRFDLVCRLLLE